MSAPINMPNGKPKENNTTAEDSPNSQIPKTESNAETQKLVTRIVSVNMLDTLSELDHAGASAGVWKPAEGRHVDVFGENLDAETSMDSQMEVNQLRNVTLKEAELLQSHSDYPFPLAVNVSCCPKNEILECGERCTYTALPNSKSDKRQVLFTANRDIAAEQQWKTTFKEYNAHNLETHGVMDVKAAPYMFVKDTHPVIAVLRVNPDLIGDDIDRQQKIDGEWFKISRDVVSKCAGAIRKDILSKVTTHDLTNFHVSISRPGGLAFNDMDDMSLIRSRTQPKVKMGMSQEEIGKMEEFENKKILNTPFQYNARIKLTYELGD